MLRRTLLAALLAASCQRRASAPDDPPPAAPQPAPSPAPPPVPPRPADPFAGPPIPCASDADCRPSACGPCDPGTPIPSSIFGVTCTVNPCVQPSAVCSPAHVCVVGPDTRRNPAMAR